MDGHNKKTNGRRTGGGGGESSAAAAAADHRRHFQTAFDMTFRRIFFFLFFSSSFLLLFTLQHSLVLATEGVDSSSSLEIVDFRWEPKIPFVCLRLTFECQVSDASAVVWFTLDGNNLTREQIANEDVELEEEERRVESIRSIVVECPQVSDSGNYGCHAMLPDQIETLVERTTKILILSLAASFQVETIPLVMGSLYHKLQIPCRIRSLDNSSLHVLNNAHWTKDGRKLLLSRYDEPLPIVDNDGDGLYELPLTLMRVQLTDIGLYTCVVPSIVGDVRSTTYVIIPEMLVPSKPNVQYVSSSSDVLVTWLPPDLRPFVDGRDVSFSYRIFVQTGNVTERRVIYSDTGGNSWIENRSVYLFRNLSEGQFYKFEIAACLKNGKCGRLSEPAVLANFKSFPFPENVNVICRYDNVSHGSIVDITWDPPKSFVDIPLTYAIEVFGSSVFLGVDGRTDLEEETQKYNSEKTFWRHLVKSNTNYSVQVCVVTSHGCGDYSLKTNSTSCSTPPGVPNELPSFTLHNADPSSDEVRLQLDMHRITERQGPISCYRVVVYKLRPGQVYLLDSNFINIWSYDVVHSEGGYGAYVAEAFDSDHLKPSVTLGDEDQSKCGMESSSSDDRRQRREADTVDEVFDTEETETSDDADLNVMVYDGKLEPDTRYSGFVEVVVIGFDGKELKRRSRMFPVVRTQSMVGFGVMTLPTALGIISGLFGIILVLVVALCVLRKRSLTQRPAGVPFLPLPSTKPIRKEGLVAAYVERHKDSDLLFQREYEMLPEYFKDRTSRSSDCIDNFFKNRYPDIKAYDQTRVKLSVTNGNAGSDYINANYVQGYKSQKKFVCAQGPLDKTVNDFWRLIWEQRVEIIAMVTGLEENGKTKCAKYWPEEGEAKYEDLSVSTTEEVIYGEYAVRRFVVSCGVSEEIAPEPLNVVQFHYLAWRDFLAPDHPGGILKFIKRIREAHDLNSNKGYLLVHCSAGVGRTGTLVAIDSLLDQMEEEGQVDVFHFVASIRRCRNFLVQSLTQYIFIYRALAEFAQFEDTEIEARNFATTVQRLGSIGDDGKPVIQKEFEKLDDVIEDYKTTDIGTMDINVNNNRYDYIVPFDNNRVVLTPLPSASNSTYINASIIQGYDRTATYIITQDPLDCTFGQFWRMIHEHCVSVVVMLSDLGDVMEKCPQYWPEETEMYDHIKVSLQDTEDTNGNTIRKFLINNTKTSSSHTMTHIQFKGWGSACFVPTSNTQLLSLIEHVHGLQAADNSKDPITVHCSGGGERSSLFVALSILVLQATAERRLDVFHVVSNLRTQRKFMISDVKQYQFCYDAIAEFVRKRGLDQ